MKNILCLTLAACALGALPAAYAADKDNPFYAGATVGFGTQLTHEKNGVRVDSNKSRPLRLYGGYDLNQNFAIEAGYTRFGGFKFPNGVSTDVDSLHLAMKGAIALGDSWSLHGKVGMSNVALTEKRPLGTGKANDLRPLLGVGASFRLTNNVALTLDVTDYGSLKGPGLHITPRTAEVGLRYQW
ncbi:MAG: porin family protein [Pseudomonadota bacterium]